MLIEARQLLESGGRAAVGWREIAGKVGVSPATLYTYFDNLDDLFARLILQSYHDLSHTIEQILGECAAAPIEDRVLAGPLAYRRWALANRGQFNLIFTDQLPGYAADPDGPSVDAEIAVFRPMASALAEALGEPDDVDVTGGAGVERFIGLWSTFHGFTMLEVNHHLDWVDTDHLFEEQVRRQLEQLGVGPAGDVAARLDDAAAGPT